MIKADITFTTETGSRYEVDTDAKLIRRVYGDAPPTPRQGDGGLWKPYIRIKAGYTGQEAFAIGVGAMIVWSVTKGGTVEECTLTSPLAELYADGVPCLTYHYSEGNEE